MKFAVVAQETKISVKHYDTEAEAREAAEWMTDYHWTEFVVEEVYEDEDDS